jgi:hypothetical protein
MAQRRFQIVFEAFDTDWRSWSFAVWYVHAFGLYTGVGFVYFWIRLHSLAVGAADGMPEQVRRYNKALQGFPNAVYAKMFGLSAVEPQP